VCIYGRLLLNQGGRISRTHSEDAALASKWFMPTLKDSGRYPWTRELVIKHFQAATKKKVLIRICHSKDDVSGNTLIII
jgi:hypothetical protein